MTAVALATFGEEGPFLRARLRAVTDGRRIVGEWMPYPSAALAGADGTRGILLATVAAGVIGAASLFALTAWSAIHAYPTNAGGRPLFSWPAFLPAVVEVGALAAAIGGTALFFRRAGLTRLHHPAFELDEVAEASGGAWILAVTCDAGEDANAALGLLAAAGAAHSRLWAP